MNTPYVKQYDENGIVSNPIKGELLHTSPNRRQRRADLQKSRFRGNGKNYPLSVVGNTRYVRFAQSIFTNEGIKTILHYAPRVVKQKNAA